MSAISVEAMPRRMNVDRNILNRALTSIDGCPDPICMRRNYLVALWAGKLGGLEGDELTAYAAHERFLSCPDDEIVDGLLQDLLGRGLLLTADDVRGALRRCHSIALRQACITD